MASSSDISCSHAYGITGASSRPSRASPLRSARTISASLHAPSPVAESGVRFDARTTPSRQSRNARPPSSGASSARSAPTGAWHCAQAAALRTTYAPRSTTAAVSAAGTLVSDGSGTRPW